MSAVKFSRAEFFNYCRAAFGGRLTQSQVEGTEKILDEAIKRGVPLNQLAYILATVWHETAHTMQPIRERGSNKYLRSKPYFPWVGEGLVQVTWEVNHRKFGANKPGQLMQWPIALRALFDGMLQGMFTKYKLGDFINDTICNYVTARRVVNGMDKANLIAGYADNFQTALEKAGYGETAQKSIVIEKPVIADPEELGKNPASSKTVWTWATTAIAAPLAAFGNLDWRVQLAIIAVIVGFAIYGIKRRFDLCRIMRELHKEYGS